MFSIPTSVFLVYADGSICLDILQNRWSPTYDVSSILTSIQVIFKNFFNVIMIFDVFTLVIVLNFGAKLTV